MKQNKLLRASGLLLVLTLITSCFVGGTFAKYVSEGEGTATARVAKWGVTAEWTGDLFSRVYDIGNDFTVESSDNYVVAPGTKRPEPFQLTLSGTPEVACRYEIDFDIDLNGWYIKPNGDPLGEDETAGTVETEFYCPLIFKFNQASQGTIDGRRYDTEQELKSEITRVLTENLTLTGEFQAGEELSKYFTFEWEWPFEGGSNGGNQTDAKDTYLGDKAARGEAPTIVINATATVTQID